MGNKIGWVELYILFDSGVDFRHYDVLNSLEPSLFVDKLSPLNHLIFFLLSLTLKYANKMSFKPIIKLTGHNGSIYSLINVEGDYFYSLGGDGFVVAWNKNGLDDLGRLVARCEEAIYCGYFDAELNQLIIGTISGKLLWLDLQNNSIIYSLHSHQKPVYSIKKIGKDIISCGGDGLVIWYDGNMKKATLALQVCHFSLRSIELDEEKDTIYLGASDNHLYKLSNNEKKILSRYLLHDSSIFSLYKLGDVMFTAGRDGRIKKWSLPDFECIKNVDAHNTTVNCVIHLHDLIISASKDKTIRIWDENLKLLQTIYSFDGGHINSVNSVISLDGKSKFATAGDDKVVVIFRS